MVEYILTFGSAHRALKAEDVLKDSSVMFRLLPAPKALEPHCDLVISVMDESYENALEILKKARVSPKRAYRKEGDDYVEV